MIDDESTVESYNEKPEERLANMFAGYVLMFPPAIEWARDVLGLNYETCSAREIYSLASCFGVSYTSLLGHLRWSLRKLSDARYSALKRIPPRVIREDLLQGRVSRHLVVRNQLPLKIPFDLEDGDFALLPPDSITDSRSFVVIESNAQQTLVQAVKPGIALFGNKTSSWTAAARVMRRGFTGRAIFRNLETDDDE